MVYLKIPGTKRRQNRRFREITEHRGHHYTNKDLRKCNIYVILFY